MFDLIHADVSIELIIRSTFTVDTLAIFKLEAWLK